MDEEFLIFKLTVGIWTIDNDGISTRMNQNLKNFIPNHYIRHPQIVDGIEVWEKVIHLSRKTWIDEDKLRDLLTAFSLKRRLLEIKTSNCELEKVDRNTIIMALKIMNEDLSWLDF